ncbi:MAG: sugar phosphate isomerase/epimerase [Verrucomicrobia bacterium]|nr:sugar phosphate isomerase/epimerase [Verrucomicrobiota bacterium]
MKNILKIAAALALSFQAFAETPAEKLGFALAVHSYTFQKFSIHDAIEKTAALGVTRMSISGNVNLAEPDGKLVKTPTVTLSEKDFSDIQIRMKEKGISPVFVNMGVVKLGIDEAENRKVFDNAKRMGIGVLVTEPEVHGKMEELGPVMDVIERLAKEYNIRVAIHNHPGPKNFYWHPDTVLAAVSGRSTMVGACADVGHWVRSGLDPVDSLRKLEGRVIALHFKDLDQATLAGHDVPWGSGISNTRAMLEELKRQKFKGAICIEYEFNWENSVPEIAKSVEWFNAACAELAAQ